MDQTQLQEMAGRFANRSQGAYDMKVDARSIYLETNWNPSVWHTLARRLWGWHPAAGWQPVGDPPASHQHYSR